MEINKMIVENYLVLTFMEYLEFTVNLISAEPSISISLNASFSFNRLLLHNT